MRKLIVSIHSTFNGVVTDPKDDETNFMTVSPLVEKSAFHNQCEVRLVPEADPARCDFWLSGRPRGAIEVNRCGEAFLEARGTMPESCKEFRGVDPIGPVRLKPHFH
jgi:hypothetical protein